MPAEKDQEEQRRAEVQRQIDETQTSIVNAQRFLNQLSDSEHLAREHVERLLRELESRLDELDRRRQRLA